MAKAAMFADKNMMNKLKKPAEKGKHKSISQDYSNLSLLEDWLEICEEEGVINVPRLKRKDATPEEEGEEEVSTEILLSGEETKGSFNELEVVGPLIGTELSSAFGKLLLLSTNLKIIRLSNCDLRAEHIIMLAYYIEQHASITDVYLDCNPHAQDFGPIACCTNIEILSLRMCALTSKGIKPIADALCKNDNLIILNLTINLIDDDGVIRLANALKMNKTLKALSLAGNKISDAGADYLFKSFMKYTLSQADIEVWKEWLAKRNELIVSAVMKKWKELSGDNSKKDTSTSHRIQSKQPKSSSTRKSPKRSESLKLGDNRPETDTLYQDDDTTKETTGEEEDRTTCVYSFTETITDFTDFADLLQSDADARDVKGDEDIVTALGMVDELMKSDMGLGPCPLGNVQDENPPVAIGNCTLKYLNVAFNEFTEKPLKSLLRSLRFQREHIRYGANNGLKTVLFKGNKICGSNEIRAKIRLLLQNTDSDTPAFSVFSN